jgi:hypothetical protein
MTNPTEQIQQVYLVKGFLIEANSQQEAEELYPEILNSTHLRWLNEYNQHKLAQLTSSTNKNNLNIIHHERI